MRAPAGRDAESLVPGEAQRRSPRAAQSVRSMSVQLNSTYEMREMNDYNSEK